MEATELRTEAGEREEGLWLDARGDAQLPGGRRLEGAAGQTSAPGLEPFTL